MNNETTLPAPSSKIHADPKGEKGTKPSMSIDVHNNVPSNKIIFLDNVAAARRITTPMNMVQKFSKTNPIEQHNISNNNSRTSDFTDSLGDHSGKLGV